ncbi:MAG: hypothetical protein PHT07_15620 [Paludibacter sp.]|nr:hypothetical protein [Paludibacter sp.]
MSKLVLTQTEPDEQFDIRFKELFGITFTDWQKTAMVNANGEMIEYNDGRIFAGMTAYDSGFKVYVREGIITANEPVWALSWREPYASLMLQGKIETRFWSTNYRGLVLICATKKHFPPKEVRRISGEKQTNRINHDFDYGGDYTRSRLCGYAFATGRLVDCRPMYPHDENDCYVEYNPNLFCFVFKEVTRIAPFAWTGTQRWKVLTKNQVKQIQYL